MLPKDVGRAAELVRPGALEILKAFSAISDPRGRSALLAVAEEMARRDQPRPRHQRGVQGARA